MTAECGVLGEILIIYTDTNFRSAVPSAVDPAADPPV